MDDYFMQMKSVANAQTRTEESITCIAVKEDRPQNIMSSVALKKGVEEPGTIERVAKFIDLLGYREITLKSDTEPAIIVCVQKSCKLKCAKQKSPQRTQ